MKKNLTSLFFFLLLFAGKTATAQDSCAVAVNFNLQNQCLTNLSSPKTEYWISFVASKSAHSFEVTSATNSPNPVYDVSAYSGSCNSLLPLLPHAFSSHDSIVSFTMEGLVTGQTYYLKLISFTLGNCRTCNITPGKFSVCEVNTGCGDNTPCTCIPPVNSCEMVCNGDFETNSGLPGALSLIDLACGWASANNATPDYFFANIPPTALCTHPADILCNGMGSETAHSGSGAAGIIVSQNDGWSEYIYKQLNYAMSPGVSYNVSMWVSLGDFCRYGTNVISICFGNTAADVTDFSTSGPLFPANFAKILPLQTNAIVNTNGWIQLNWTYTAFGGEKFMAIGDYDVYNVATYVPISPLGTLCTTFPSTGGTTYYGYTDNIHGNTIYYYIDDVSVIPTCCPIAGESTFNNVTVVAGENAAVSVPVNTYSGTTLSYTFPCGPTPCYNAVNFSAGTNVAITGTLTLSPPPPPPNVQIGFIYGHVTMNANHVRLGVNAKIIVEAGVVLNIIGSHLEACNQMWDQIEVQPGARLVIDGSLIEDAGIAALIEDNARITATRSYFNRNQVGILIDSHSAGSSSDVSVTSCYFTCRDFSNTPSLDPIVSTLPFPFQANIVASRPLSTLKGNSFIANNITGTSGVQFIFNSVSFDIGATGGPNGGSNNTANIFDYLNNGVFISLSKVNVLNNIFKSIQITGTNAAQAGVRISGGNNVNGGVITNVGNGNATGTNIFTNSIRGVWETGYGKLTVDKNTFNLLSPGGSPSTGGQGVHFELWNAPNLPFAFTKPVLIQNNTFTNDFIGISGFNNNTIYASILSNTISHTNPYISGVTGINLVEIIPINSVRYLVQGASNPPNQQVISDVEYGINCANLDGAYYVGTMLHYGVQIKHNKILNRPTIFGGVGFDVKMSNCTGIEVFGNNLKVSSSVPSGNTTDFGMYASDCNLLLESCNTVAGTGVPVMFTGPSTTPGSLVLGNDIMNGTYGIWLDNAANIGNVDDGGGLASDNIWGTFSGGCYSNVTNGANSVPGGFKILYRSGSPQYQPQTTACQIPLSGGNQLFAQIAPGSTPNLHSHCAVPPLAFVAPGGGNNKAAVASFINNGFTFPANDAQFKYNGKHRLINLMRRGIIDPQSDPTFASFVSASSTNNFGEFFKIDSLLQTGVQNNSNTDLNNARTMNTSAVVANAIEQHHKDINNLYLNYVQNGTLTAGEIVQAQSIAVLCPFTDGAAVYQARAILLPFDSTDYFNSCEFSVNSGSGNRVAANAVTQTEKNDDIMVYPNPTENSVFVYLKEAPGDKVEFMLFDISGKQVLSKVLKMENQTSEVDLKELNNGVYLFKIVSQNFILKQDRLIIAK